MSFNLLTNAISTTVAPYWRPLKQKFEAHPIASALVIGSVLTIAAINARPLLNRIYVAKQNAVEPTTELTPSNPAPISTPVQQSAILAQLKEAHRETSLHRTHDKFYPLDVPLRPVENEDFFDCDPHYSKLFHNLAAQFFSGGNLKQYESMMREKAGQLLKDELSIDDAIEEYMYQMFCEIMFGYQGKYKNDKRHLKSSDDFLLFRHSDPNKKFMSDFLLPLSDPNKFLAAIQDNPYISDQQAKIFIQTMWNITNLLARKALHHEIERACRHPDLQEKASNTVNQKDLDDQILRFIIEEHRIRDLNDDIRRGPNFIFRHKDFAKKEEVVGANPETFNPNRYEKLPSSWYGLPWMPFGNGGPNRCPGMAFHQYLSKQFLKELFLNYRLAGIDEFGKVVTDAHTRISKVIISDRKSSTFTNTLHSTAL